MKAEDWIKVTDRLPIKEASVLTYATLFGKAHSIFEGYWDGENWRASASPDLLLVGVTHWMYIVKPKED